MSRETLNVEIRGSRLGDEARRAPISITLASLTGGICPRCAARTRPQIQIISRLSGDRDAGGISQVSRMGTLTTQVGIVQDPHTDTFNAKTDIWNENGYQRSGSHFYCGALSADNKDYVKSRLKAAPRRLPAIHSNGSPGPALTKINNHVIGRGLDAGHEACYLRSSSQIAVDRSLDSIMFR